MPREPCGAVLKQALGRVDVYDVMARVRENALWGALAGATTLAIAWLGLAEFGWNDYQNEASAAVEALVHGHLHTFFGLAPVYGGSLLERAPFALVPSLWGGGELAVYRMLALPCLLAAAALGLWLCARMREQGRSRLACALALLLCTANPLTLVALEIGHPDEILGGALCVGAVLGAARGHTGWAALALGLAIANKQWALLAVGPVLIALPARRALCMALAVAVSAAVMAPFALLATGSFTTGVRAVATTTGAVFRPAQLWWFLGHPTRGLHETLGAGGLSSRLPPGWVATFSHPLILAVAVPLTLAAWMRLRSARRPAPRTPGEVDAGQARLAVAPESAALLLLALLLLLRCVLDPWDNIYYPLPFVLALLAWEVGRRRRVPLLAFGATAAVWVGHVWLTGVASQDTQAVLFAAWTVPLAIGLGARLLAHDRQLLGQGGQELVALGGEHRQILDAHPQLAG